MNIEETAAVLAKAAGYDNRNVGRANVLAWYEALSDMAVGDCLDAVAQHHRESSDYLMPVHVRRIAERFRKARHELDAAERERLELEAYRASSGPLEDRSEEIRELVDQVRDALPEGKVTDLHPRREYWRREHRDYQRQVNAEPNPDYDPTLGPIATWQASKHPPQGAWWEDAAKREADACEILSLHGRLRRRHRDHDVEEAS